MNIVRFCILFVALVVLASLLFSCAAMGSVPARHSHKPKPKPPKVIVRLGQPYIAELQRPGKK